MKINAVAVKLAIIFLSCGFIIAASIIFSSPIILTDIISQAPANNFSIIWHPLRLFIEPLYSFAFYALTLERTFYAKALISWTIWLLAIVLFYCIAKEKTFKQTLTKLFYAILFFASLIAFVAVFPLPGPKLIKPNGFIAVDFHSHTRYSHDAITTENLRFKLHTWSGYDYFFISEHQNTDSFANFNGNPKVLPAMQIQTIDGVSALMIAAKPFNGADFQKMGLEDLIIKSHENNIAVIMPHWWKWHKFSFSQLKQMGIDGFEIYNCGYRNFNEQEKRELIDFSKANNLLMIGSTDFHGWGYMSDVWTVFKAKTILSQDKQNLIIPKSQVIVYRKIQSASVWRFIFEPFFAFYYYISNANTSQTFAFTIWFMIAAIITSFAPLKKFWQKLPICFILIFAATTIYYLIILIPAHNTNTIIISSVIPTTAIMSILWFALYSLEKK
jgi:hypothetical protein